MTTVGGALTGLEEEAKRGIPMMSAQSVENLGKAGKYGAPTLGIATALYDTVTAKTYQDGGAATGTLFAAGATAMALPELAPAFAFGGEVLGGWTFGYVGGIIGNIVCR